jgi:peptidoglycan-associated lipoprotein
MKKYSYLLVVALFMAGCGGEEPKTSGDASGSVELGEVKRGVVAGSQEDLNTRAGNVVYFEFDRHSLTLEATNILRKQAAWLKLFPKTNVVVEGHCDDRGTRKYNQALGERRANSAKRFLIAQGIPAARISTVSYGKDKPVALGDTEEAYAKNRRDVTLIVK